MNEDNARQGNSTIGMESDSFDAIANVDSQEENFFETLERNVNGVIADDVVQETPQVDPNTLQNQNQVSSDAQSNGVQGELEQVKKRYSDSSREAQKMKAQLDELKPFIPVLNAMKQDSGLVDHMKTYLENGGNVPTNVKEQLKLKEDFVFDADDMVNDPNSDSAQVFNSMVSNVVNTKAKEILGEQEAKAAQARKSLEYQNQAKKFIEERGMNEEEFQDFIKQAKAKMQGALSLDDMYHLLNRDQVNTRVAASTKEDMLKQMKGVRNMPTSQANVNNASEGKKDDNDRMFDSLLNFESGVDNLFG
tara:strand:- start:681 stop:1598 length:918 start_codon:yes stop_codon:yes gene_type:complete